MLTQLTNTIEQLDLAADHLAEGDPNNARFALMLSDNITELMLHQFAKDKRNELKARSWRNETFEHEKALEKALRRHFDDKVKFGKAIGKLSEEVAESVRIGHLFRNDVYHVGLQHEAVLPAIAAFQFSLTCQLCADYEVNSWGYSPDQSIPERAKKYIVHQTHFMSFPTEYAAACLALKGKSGHDDGSFAETLADHTDEVVRQQDEYIQYLADNAPLRQTRDQVIVNNQTWSLAFNEEGRQFAATNGFPGGNAFALVSWLETHYPLRFRRDPIPAWRQRADSIRGETDPHKALLKYRTFMDETSDIREAIDEATGALDQHIDEQIEHARVERALWPKDS